MPPIRHDRLVPRILTVVLAGAAGLAGAVAAACRRAERSPSGSAARS